MGSGPESAEFLLPIERLIPNQSGLVLAARSWAVQMCMYSFQKTKESLRVGLKFYANCLFENMAERVGFESGL